MARPWTSDQAPIAAISRAAGSFWGILSVLSSLPRFNTPRHTFYGSESMDNFGGKPCVRPLQFRTEHEAIPRGISCTETQIGDQDCFQRISRFCLPTQSSEQAGQKDLVTLRRDGSEELSFACEVGVRGIVAHPCAACYFAQ